MMYASKTLRFALPLALLLSGCSLDVTVLGNGSGTITSAPAGIQCQSEDKTCNARFERGSVAVLKATVEEGSRFVGWGGECSGTEPECSVRINQMHQVTALFESTEETTDSLNCGDESANAQCITPTRSPEYYVEQGEKYFHTMDSSVSIMVAPNYSELVARWEWKPWLLLTGLGRANLLWTDIMLKLFPTSYASMDCQAFDTQPFARCHVVFDYSGELCPIYEEFTFNEQGEITFIEAWSDYPGLLPMQDADDYWAEGENVNRLSTLLPGLGNATGKIDLYASWMEAVAIRSATAADFLNRARRPYREYFTELFNHTEDLLNGCRPPTTDVETH